ncbi:MAG TPA: hypothetical protein VFA26_05290 [Gemmataceae bacterium]|nr:hypothetical protein [Gemmataceae bacterium]
MKAGETIFVWGTNGMNWIGRVAAVQPFSVTLEEASWVAESGRLGQFMATGRSEHMELERVGRVTVQWTAWAPWPHKLPEKSV